MANATTKIAALLSLDIQTTALAAQAQPHMAERLLLMLEEKRLRVIEDEEYRDTRYAASMMVFQIPVDRGD